MFQLAFERIEILRRRVCCFVYFSRPTEIAHKYEQFGKKNTEFQTKSIITRYDALDRSC